MTRLIVCRCCGKPLQQDVQEYGWTSRNGTRHYLPPVLMLTCKNEDCALYYHTFSEAQYASVELSAYIRKNCDLE